MNDDKIRAIQRAVKVVVAFGNNICEEQAEQTQGPFDPQGPSSPSDQTQTLLSMVRAAEQHTPKTTLAELIAKEIEEAVLEERAQILRLIGPGCETKSCHNQECRLRKSIAREIAERSGKDH